MSDISQHDLIAFRRDLQTDMREANRPIERRQDETNKQLEMVNEHLRELNGKVALHQAKLAAGHERINAIDEDIRTLKLERREYVRRSSDRLEDEGDNRRITQREVKLAIAVVSAYTAFVVFVWKVIPAIGKLFQP